MQWLSMNRLFDSLARLVSKKLAFLTVAQQLVRLKCGRAAHQIDLDLLVALMNTTIPLLYKNRLK